MAALRPYNKRVTQDIIQDMEEDEDDDVLAPMPKRNLMSDFGRPSLLEPPVSNEHMKVFLRIRPFAREELDRNEDQGCLSVESDRMVVTNAPKDSHFYKNMTRGLSKTTTKYRFSHIFNENTTQKDFFNSTMLGYVKDFIDGQNCLVFSYGVTSSGKTYTIQGNPKDAGILPRALDVLFNSIYNRQWAGMDLKPKMFKDVARLSPEQEQDERKTKDMIMKLSLDADQDVMSLLGDDASDISVMTNTTTCSESSNISSLKDSLDGNETLFRELESRVREEGKVSVEEQGQVRFCVWVSFAEIYNEQIYDLLVPVPKKKNTRRPCLKLSEDKNGSPYIKGLKYVHVSTADEAYKLLTIGQRNLQTACTKLNHNSSRSHCIFNIKILRVVDKDNPHVARVSTLTLCDLAGSERYSKTQNTGERLKEAGNINTSLLTLGRCIETLRYNQSHKDQTKIIPFRESKLTRLFQNFFVGQGKAAMIVNVNPLASMFDETMHVFKFSAIASKVEVVQKPVFIKPKLPVAPSPAHIPRTSISWATPARETKISQAAAENLPVPDDDDDDDLDEEEEETVYTQENIDELLGIIDQLQKDLQEEVESKWRMEKIVRAEVCDEMMKQFAEIEEEHSERLRRREQHVEELAEARFQIQLEAERAKHREATAASYMMDGEDEWVSSVLLTREQLKVEERDATIKQLQAELEALKSKDADLETAQQKILSLEQTISEDSRCKEVLAEKVASLQQELAKKGEASVDLDQANLIENLTQQLQQAKQQMKEQEKEVGELNDMLTEAGETFEQKQAEISKLRDLNTEYERRMETQSEAIAVLERAAADSKVAMETADQSLSQREDCVASLQANIRDLEGTDDTDIVPETPSKSENSRVEPQSDNIPPIASQLEKFRKSLSSIDFSFTNNDNKAKCTTPVGSSLTRKGSYHGDSSGVVADMESEDEEVTFKTHPRPKPPAQPAGTDCHSVGKFSVETFQEHSSVEYSGSDVSDLEPSPTITSQKPAQKSQAKMFNFKGTSKVHNSNYFKFHKPLNDSRVLQVVLSPIKNKTLVKHTKSSMLRLKNSPVKDPTRGRACMRNSPLSRRSLSITNKENKPANKKRKCDENDSLDDFVCDDLNTSKRRRVQNKKTAVTKKHTSTKPAATNRTGQKYNLRTRR